MPRIEDTLRNLRDVQGVNGSFVIAGSGVLIARDLPAIFDGDLFSEVGPRITRLYETFLSGGEELDACMIRFSEQKLYLRRMTWGVIGILCNVGVNLPALRMVANLVIRRVDPEVVPSMRRSVAPAIELGQNPSGAPPARATPPPPRVDLASADASQEVPDAPSGKQVVRMYRGRPVVED
ncbi:MAG: hypothetical protein ABSC94_11365 [Polyangiaceae bacterium]|jgi:predicted regulator of Ras-like GTPase activity (Roadblock/LC7/MglB family)